MLGKAPGKVILFGEHAINRGQPALAASVGLYVQCRVSPASIFSFRSGEKSQSCDRKQILQVGKDVDEWRKSENFEAVRRLAAEDYFAPQKYILASMFWDSIPQGLSIEWESQIPSSSGLGSGGSAFTAMVAALGGLFPKRPALLQRAEWAQLGDMIAHGGIASGLDTQTSLLGGVIHYTGTGLAEPVPCAPGFALVIAHCGVAAATSEINTRVRLWLAEKPASRVRYFESIGALTRSAILVLARGEWEELGRLFTLNQLVLERIGVSCAEIDKLIEAALEAGAFGAKISGSGGGGIIIAVTDPAHKQDVAKALAAAGAKVMTPDIAVAGAAASEF